MVEEDGFTEYPQCYGFIDEAPSESVFLEDLSAREFRIIDRHSEDVTADHVRLVMQALGKFHAISFALKDQQPQKFQQLASNLNEIFIRQNDKRLRDMFLKNSKFIINSLYAAEDAYLLEKVKKVLEKHPVDVAAECIDLEETGAASVIGHGDTWQNNSMFQYDKNGIPIKVNLLDYQISRHSSPIIDIVYYIFCCTTKEIRDVHYEQFLKIYHDTLFKHIRRYVLQFYISMDSEK